MTDLAVGPSPVCAASATGPGGAAPGVVAGLAADADHRQTLVALAALRASGGHRADPVQFHFLEALARRCATQAGEVRRLLDTKLDQALAAYGAKQGAGTPVTGADLGAAPARPAGLAPGPATPADVASPLGPLATLVFDLNRGAAALVAGPAAAAGATPAANAPGELKAMRHYRRTWAQQRMAHQLLRSTAQLPGNAGPLNTQLLVLRTLEALRDASPAYLERYLAYLDTLLWLEDAQGSRPNAPAKTAQGEPGKKRKPATTRRAGPAPPAGHVAARSVPG